jgi:inhibitor of cysteine peptidase
MRRNVSILFGVVVLAAMASPAAAKLCGKCEGKMYIASVGKCVECGKWTSSGAFKLCKKCSTKLGQCEHCRAPLGGGKEKPDAKPDTSKPIALDKSASGRTVTPAPGQQVVISLKGNPTTGYSWSCAKIEGDAAVAVGKVAYVRDPSGPRRAGSGGTFVATFKATKIGKSKITLEYKRPWEKGKPAAETFTLTVEVKSERAEKRAQELKRHASKFMLRLTCHGPDAKSYTSLVLHQPKIRFKLAANWRSAPVEKEQVERIVDHLRTDGFLDRAADISKKKIAHPTDAAYTLQLAGPPGLVLYENLEWGPDLVKRLEALRNILDGRAKTAMDDVLKKLEKLQKKDKTGATE